MAEFACPHCRASLMSSDVFGQIVACPSCGGRIGLPSTAVGVIPPPAPILCTPATLRRQRTQRSESKAFLLIALTLAAFLACSVAIYGWAQFGSTSTAQAVRRQSLQARDKFATRNAADSKSKQPSEDGPYWASPSSDDPLEGMDAERALRFRLVRSDSFGGGAWLYVRDSSSGEVYYYVDPHNKLVRYTEPRANRLANDLFNAEMPDGLGSAAYDAEIERLNKAARIEQERQAKAIADQESEWRAAMQKDIEAQRDARERAKAFKPVDSAPLRTTEAEWRRQREESIKSHHDAPKQDADQKEWVEIDRLKRMKVPKSGWPKEWLKKDNERTAWLRKVKASDWKDGDKHLDMPTKPAAGAP